MLGKLLIGERKVEVKAKVENRDEPPRMPESVEL